MAAFNNVFRTNDVMAKVLLVALYPSQAGTFIDLMRICICCTTRWNMDSGGQACQWTG